MKTAMKVVAVVVAFAFFVNASVADLSSDQAASSAPASTVAMAKTGKDAKVFQVLQSDAQYSMFYEALVNSTEIWNVEGRTVVEGQQLILFAPTNVALTDALSEDVMTCLYQEPGMVTLTSFLEYFQVLLPSVPQVESPKQLVNMTKDGYLWTVSGKGIAVEEEADGSVRLTSDDEMDSVTVKEATVTDPTVTLIPLEVSIIVQAEVSENITSMCLGGKAASSTAAPSSYSLPESESSEDDADAESSEPATDARSLSRRLWALLF